MSKSSSKPPAGEPLAVPLKFGIMNDWQQEFTRKQRWQIFVGYTLVIKVRIATQHNPGQHEPFVQVETSKDFREPNKIPAAPLPPPPGPDPKHTL